LLFKNNLVTKALLALGIASSVAYAQTGTTPSTSSLEHLYRAQLSTGTTIYDTLQGVRLQTATKLASSRPAPWRLIGATVPPSSGNQRLVYFDNSTRALSASIYGGANHATLLSSAPLVTVGAGSSAQAVADFNLDGSLDVIATDDSSGDIHVYFFGGAQGSSLLKKEIIAGLNAGGSYVIGAADLNADGHPDLILQNRSTREVMIAYLGGSNGITVLSTHNLESSTFAGWTAAGMQDMNGDGHADLILVNDKTGESIVNYYGGEMGFTYAGSAYLDPSGSPDWKIVVPAKSAVTTSDIAPTGISATATATTSTTTTTTPSAAVPVLVYNGLGTSSTDVTAVEAIVTSMGLAYATANSSQLNAMSQSQLQAYKLFLMPGGNSITIGSYLTKNATATLHNAVSAGLNYLGICAGGFFGGFSAYNNFTNLTSGVWFSVYPNNGNGTGKTAVNTHFPNGSTLDVYWQDGPELGGWGNVVAKYPNGQPAITEGYLGTGFVLLSGVHYEAPSSWRTGMTFTTPLDVDLAYAKTLVNAALNRSPLPHF
jgi:hypothetical protein